MNDTTTTRFADISDHFDDFKLGENAEIIELEASIENQQVAAHMAAQAKRTIRIFTRDLEPVIYDQTDFVEACKKLALRGRFSRIEILAFNSRRIVQRGHRLITLSRALSSYIQIRRPDEQYENRFDTFMTIDEKGYIYRKNSERFEGRASFYQPREARELDKDFSEMWQRSHTDTEIRQLNL